MLAKRDRMGLSDWEADELGRLFAEKKGKRYSNALTLRTTARVERRRAFHRFRRAVQPAA